MMSLIKKIYCYLILMVSIIGYQPTQAIAKDFLLIPDTEFSGQVLLRKAFKPINNLVFSFIQKNKKRWSDPQGKMMFCGGIIVIITLLGISSISLKSFLQRSGAPLVEEDDEIPLIDKRNKRIKH